MRIDQYVEIILRRKWLVVVVLAATVAGVAALTLSMTPVYSSTCIVRIARVEDNSGYYSNLAYVDRLMSTYVELLQGSRFL